MAVKSYRDLEVWQVAMEVAKKCYELTKVFPKCELFGMTSQIRRAAVSIPANIAEGQGRNGTGEYLHHLGIARGSLMELETHMILCQRIGLVKETECAEMLQQAERVSRMLSRLRQALENRTES